MSSARTAPRRSPPRRPAMHSHRNRTPSRWCGRRCLRGAASRYNPHRCLRALAPATEGSARLTVQPSCHHATTSHTDSAVSSTGSANGRPLSNLSNVFVRYQASGRAEIVSRLPRITGSVPAPAPRRLCLCRAWLWAAVLRGGVRRRACTGTGPPPRGPRGGGPPPLRPSTAPRSAPARPPRSDCECPAGANGPGFRMQSKSRVC